MDSFPQITPTDHEPDVLGLPAGVPTFLRVQPQPATVGFDGLADLLHINRATVVTLHSRARDRLPPAFKAPGSREPLWIVGDVLAWLRRHPESSTQTDVQTAEPKQVKRRPGRPTKSEQVAARKAAAAAGVAP